MDSRTIDELKVRGQGRTAPEAVLRLYRQAFQEFGNLALWSRRPSEHPTIAQALRVADCLRNEGNIESRALAVRIEETCRAAL